MSSKTFSSRDDWQTVCHSFRVGCACAPRQSISPACACTCRSSQENGEFAGSFWLCAQCAKALSPLSALLVTPELTGTVSALYEETVARLESSLQTVCADFQPDPYAKVSKHPSSVPAQSL